MIIQNPDGTFKVTCDGTHNSKCINLIDFIPTNLMVDDIIADEHWLRVGDKTYCPSCRWFALIVKRRKGIK